MIKNSHYRLITQFLTVIFIVFFTACKKLDKDNPIEFNIKAHIPYNDEPIAFVKYTIREYKAKSGFATLATKEYTGFIIEGFTNANGDAQISFFPKKNIKYHYDLSFDYSNLQFQSYSGDYKLINAPNFVNLIRNDQRDYDIRAVPQMFINFKIENVYCQGVTDSMRMKIANIDEFPFTNFNYKIWGPFNTGCYIYINSAYSSSGRNVYQIEINRGGNVTQYFDTIFLAPGINNNLFIEY